MNIVKAVTAVLLMTSSSNVWAQQPSPHKVWVSFALDNTHGAYVTMNALGHYRVVNNSTGYSFPSGTYEVVGYDAVTNAVLSRETITLGANESTRVVRIGVIGRSRHGCDPGPGCNQPPMPPIPPWGDVGGVVIINQGSLPAKLIGSYSVVPEWADVENGRGRSLQWESKVIAARDSGWAGLDHTDHSPPGLQGYSQTIAVSPSGPVAIYLNGNFQAPSCPNLQWKLVINDSSDRVQTSRYSGPVMGKDDTATLCTILGCPTGGSTFNGVPLKNAVVVTTAPQGVVSWSCR